MLQRPCHMASGDFHEPAHAFGGIDPNGDLAHAALQHIVIKVTVTEHAPG
jgi:hypothetical protein